MKKDAMLLLTALVTIAAVIKFLLDGVTIHNSLGLSLDFGHMDSMSYACLLSPIVGAHSYLSVKKGSEDVKQ